MQAHGIVVGIVVVIIIAFFLARWFTQRKH